MKKYYGVAYGFKYGVTSSFNEVCKWTDGYPGSWYRRKPFYSKKEAWNWVNYIRTHRTKSGKQKRSAKKRMKRHTFVSLPKVTKSKHLNKVTGIYLQGKLDAKKMGTCGFLIKQNKRSYFSIKRNIQGLTSHELVLSALINLLKYQKKINHTKNLTVVTNSKYLYKMISKGELKKAKRGHWQTLAGYSIANAYLLKDVECKLRDFKNFKLALADQDHQKVIKDFN